MKPENLAAVWALIDEYSTAAYCHFPSADSIRADINAILARHVEQPAETEEQAALVAAAVEMTRWDWQHLLLDHPDADVIRADVTALERAIEALRLAKET